MGVVCASVPHHITAAFRPYWASSPELTGSVGVGIAVEPRLTICHEVKGGGELTLTAQDLLKSEGLDVQEFSSFMPLPWGVGYAVSGASSVAAALLIAQMRGKGIFSALAKAHEIEVRSRTGLGDVLALSCGVGLIIRRRPGAPGTGSVECLYFPRSLSIASLEGGSMSTSELLSSLDENYFREADKLISAMISEPSVDLFLEQVKVFTDSLGLLKSALGDRADLVRQVPGIVSYYAKKKLAVLIIERQLIDDAIAYLLDKMKPFNLRLLEASTRGPYIW